MWKYIILTVLIYAAVVCFFGAFIFESKKPGKAIFIFKADRLFNKFHVIYMWVLFFTFVILAAAVLMQFIIHQSNNVIDAIVALKFYDFLKFLTPLEACIIAMLPLCTALQHKFYAVVDIKELLNSYNILTKAHKIITCNVIAWVSLLTSSILSFWDKEPKEIITVYTIFCQCYIAVLIASSIYFTISLLNITLKLFLQEHPKALMCLNDDIYSKYRKSRKNFTLKNKYSINSVMRYLFLMISDTPPQIIKEFDKTHICNFSFENSYNKLPLSLRIEMALHAVGYMSLIVNSLLITFLLLINYTAVPLKQQVSFVFCTCTVLNVIVIALSFWKAPKIRASLIFPIMNKWGFQCKDAHGKSIYFCKYKHHFLSPQYGKKEQQYVTKMYNIISLFRDALDSDQELSEYILKVIGKESQKIQSGYLIYYICLNLYDKQYSNHGQDIATDILPFDTQKKERAIIAHNTDVFVDDILKYNQ